ncbi:MAG TPA: hypothetical protein VHB21_14900, partial [Minicystis sp.]|nr:hypothetical protein [Minicystis sp.]
MKAVPACLAALAVLAAAPLARATPDFPAAIQSDLMLSYTPNCSLCHANGVTNASTVTTPFGKSMLAAGLHAGDEASLQNALNTLQTDMTDSDGDGTPDIQELQNDTDPNGAGTASSIAYGCGAEIAAG